MLHSARQALINVPSDDDNWDAAAISTMAAKIWLCLTIPLCKESVNTGADPNRLWMKGLLPLQNPILAGLVRLGIRLVGLNNTESIDALSSLFLATTLQPQFPSADSSAQSELGATSMLRKSGESSLCSE